MSKCIERQLWILLPCLAYTRATMTVTHSGAYYDPICSNLITNYVNGNQSWWSKPCLFFLWEQRLLCSTLSVMCSYRPKTAVTKGKEMISEAAQQLQTETVLLALLAHFNLIALLSQIEDVWVRVVLIQMMCRTYFVLSFVFFLCLYNSSLIICSSHAQQLHFFFHSCFAHSAGSRTARTVKRTPIFKVDAPKRAFFFFFFLEILQSHWIFCSLAQQTLWGQLNAVSTEAKMCDLKFDHAV